MKSFEQWYKNINEDLAADPVAEPTIATEVEVETPRDAIMHDVDSIMTSLETLAAELKESLEAEGTELNEVEMGDAATIATAGVAAGAGLAFAIKWAIDKFKAKKAQKNQQNVNDMLMKVEVARIKIGEIEGEKGKEAAEAKVEKMKATADDLQKTIEETYENAGNIVKSAISAEKLKGKIERTGFLAKETGDPEYKEQLAKYKEKYKDTLAEIEQIAKDGEEKAKKSQKAPEGSTPEDASKAKIKEYEEAIEALKAKKDKKSQNDINLLQGLVKAEKDKLSKMSAKESLVTRALDANLNELAEEIASKLEWQLTEGTALYVKYNTIIKKAESDNQLNEALYTSVKDRFRNLL